MNDVPSRPQRGLMPSQVAQSTPEEGPALCERAFSPRGSHPSHVELELLHLGEASDEVKAHVRACLACRKWVEELDAEREQMLQAESSEAFIQRLVEVEPGPPVPRRSWGATVYGAMAVAASVAVFVIATASLRSVLTDVPVPSPAPQVVIGSQREVLTPKGGGEARGEVRETPPVQLRSLPSVYSETPSRGGPLVIDDLPVVGFPRPNQEASVQNLQLIRQRAARQKSFVGKVPVMPGDQIGLRFTLTEPSSLVGGVLHDDGSWFALFEGNLDAGIHSPPSTIRVTQEPAGGWALVGAPGAVVHARQCLHGTRALSRATGVAVAKCTEGSVLAARLEWGASRTVSPKPRERKKLGSKDGSEFEFGF